MTSATRRSACAALGAASTAHTMPTTIARLRNIAVSVSVCVAAARIVLRPCRLTTSSLVPRPRWLEPATAKATEEHHAAHSAHAYRGRRRIDRLGGGSGGGRRGLLRTHPCRRRARVPFGAARLLRRGLGNRHAGLAACDRPASTLERTDAPAVLLKRGHDRARGLVGVEFRLGTQAELA